MTDPTTTPADKAAVQPSAADTAAQLTVVAALASEPGPKVRDELEFRVAAAMEGAARRLPAFVLLMLVEAFEFVERLPSDVLAAHIETFRTGFEAVGPDVNNEFSQLLHAVETYGKAVMTEADPAAVAAAAADAAAQPPQPGMPGHHYDKPNAAPPAPAVVEDAPEPAEPGTPQPGLPGGHWRA